VGARHRAGLSWRRPASDLAEVRPGATLLAGRYSLLDHELALQRLMPAAAAKGIDIVIGGP
jgi:D-threo-aldose 1-dehydrogenase